MTKKPDGAKWFRNVRTGARDRGTTRYAWY